MKKLTYKIIPIDEVTQKKQLVEEEWFDENNNSIYHVHYGIDPLTYRHYIYDEKSILIKEFETDENGEKISETTYQTDEKGELLQSLSYIQGELFEKVSIVANDKGYIQNTYKDELLCEKLTYLHENESSKTEIFEHGVLIETIVTIYLKEKNTRTTIHFNEDLQETFKQVEMTDENGYWLESEWFEKGQLIHTSKRVLNGEKIISETYSDLVDKANDYIETYEYDSSDNMTHYQKKTPTGDLLSFSICKYDNQNRMTELSSLSTGQAFGFGTAAINDKSHKIFEYVD